MLMSLLCHDGQDPNSLEFVENPVFNECFPNSTKMYKEVEHNGETMQVFFPLPLPQWRPLCTCESSRDKESKA